MADVQLMQQGCTFIKPGGLKGREIAMQRRTCPAPIHVELLQVWAVIMAAGCRETWRLLAVYFQVTLRQHADIAVAV